MDIVENEITEEKMKQLEDIIKNSIMKLKVTDNLELSDIDVSSITELIIEFINSSLDSIAISMSTLCIELINEYLQGTDMGKQLQPIIEKSEFLKSLIQEGELTEDSKKRIDANIPAIGFSLDPNRMEMFSRDGDKGSRLFTTNKKKESEIKDIESAKIISEQKYTKIKVDRRKAAFNRKVFSYSIEGISSDKIKEADEAQKSNSQMITDNKEGKDKSHE